MELCSNELIDKQHDAYSAQEPENARRRQDEAKQSLQALRDGTEGDRESYTEALERIEILKETIKEFKQTIARNTKVRRPLYAKLAILNILCCQNLDAIPTDVGGILVFCNRSPQVHRRGYDSYVIVEISEWYSNICLLTVCIRSHTTKACC